GKEVRRLDRLGERVWAVAWSPEGKSLASAGAGTLRLWDAANGLEIRRIVCPGAEVLTVAWSPDGKTLACGGHTKEGGTGNPERSIWLFDVATGKEIRGLAAQDHVWSVAWSPDSQLLAAGGRDNSVCLWEVATGKEVRRLVGHEDSLWAVGW